MMAKAMVPIWLLSWIILLPVDAAGSYVEGKSGLDRLTFGNVARDKQSRYWSHLLLDYCFICELTALRGGKKLRYPSLDTLSHLARDGTLACDPAEAPYQPSALEVTTSEYCPRHRHLQELHGRGEA